MISKKIMIGGPPCFSRNGDAMVFPDLEEKTLVFYNVLSSELKKISMDGPIFDPRISLDGNKLYYAQLSEQ